MKRGFVFLMLVLALAGGIKFAKTKLDRQEHALRRAQKNAEAWEYSTKTAWAHMGHVVRWPSLTRIGPLGAEAGPQPGDPSWWADGHAGYRLVLYVDDVSCDVCRDEETTFVKEIAAAVGEAAVVVVVRASNRRYLTNYMRMNGLQLPVFSDDQGHFAKAVGLSGGPSLLLLNDRNEVIAAHRALTGRARLNGMFHDGIRHFFGMAPGT